MGSLPRIRRNNIEIMAITNSTWISEPALKTKNPSNHPIIRITAMIYSREFMVQMFIPIVAIPIPK